MLPAPAASEQSSKSWSNIQRLSEANAKETAEMLAAFEDLAFLQGKTEQLLAGEGDRSHTHIDMMTSLS